MQETSFANWKCEVDKILIKVVGLPSEHLPDVDYRGLYNTGNSPKEAAEFCIQEGLDSDFLIEESLNDD